MPQPWDAVYAVYDHHAVHALPSPPVSLVGFDVDASLLEDVAVDLILDLAYFYGGEGSREINL